jgi:hypothetical protein
LPLPAAASRDWKGCLGPAALSPMEMVSSSIRLRTLFLRALCAFFFLAGASRALPAVQPPSSSVTLIYTKVLKGSVPEYLRIAVHPDGEGTYDGRKLSQPPQPRKMMLSPVIARDLFSLAGALGDFQSVRLASHKRVANLGLKTLEYQTGRAAYKAEFNYTQNHAAERLVDLFEGISAVEQHIGALDFSSRYDPLGVPHELLLIEIDLDNKSLVDPQLMEPILERISKDDRFMHIAQVRARNILHKIGTD